MAGSKAINPSPADNSVYQSRELQRLEWNKGEGDLPIGFLVVLSESPDLTPVVYNNSTNNLYLSLPPGLRPAGSPVASR